MDGVRGAFLSAGAALEELLSSPAVAASWSSPSALSDMTVGAVAGHLVRALDTVEQYLDLPAPGPEVALLDAAEYYRVALGGMTAEQAAAIRARGADAAVAGAAALAAEHVALVSRLRDRLATEPPARRMTVLRGGAHMLLDDYLPTRVVEIVIHADDLAVSVGAPSVPFSADVTGLVIDTLVQTARITHGDLAVVRALSRRERDVGVNALRVL